MKPFAAVIAVVVFGLSGICRADDDSPKRVRTVPVPAGAGLKTNVGDPAPVAPVSGTVRVAQKAVLYEEDPSNPTGAQFDGAVVWRTEKLPLAPGQKPDVLIRADIEIAARRLSMLVVLRRNFEERLPASHAVEILFTLPPGFSHGDIADVTGILMKQGETPRGSALNGVRVKVASNYFLIGLSSKEDDLARNIQLLKERPWIGVLVVYADGKRALISIEKGASGERAFADAFDAWGTPVPAQPTALTAPLPPDQGKPKPVSVPGPTVVITSDKGGLIRDYFERYRAQTAAGSTFRIDGRCASACTMVLAWPDRVCITRRAVLGFHQVRDSRTGRVTADTRRATEFMLSIYPAPVRDYIATHGGLPAPADMMWVAGEALRGLVKPCEEKAPLVAADPPPKKIR